MIVAMERTRKLKRRSAAIKKRIKLKESLDKLSPVEIYDRYEAAKKRLEELEKVESETNEYFKPSDRVVKDRLNPLEAYDDAEFQKMFRFRKETVLMFARIVDTPTYKRLHDMPPLLQVCIALRTLARAEHQSVVGKWFNVHQVTVSRSIWIFVQSLMRSFIHKVRICEDRLKASRVHYLNNYGFANVIGVTDCVHVKIGRPKAAYYPREYLNPNGHYSINVQMTCDHEGHFIDVDCSWPGGVPDCDVFKRSSLFRRLNNQEVDGVVLTDCAFPLTTFSVTPFSEPVGNNIESVFNRTHFKAWTILQQTLSQVKKRFRVLNDNMRVSQEKVPSVVMALLILNNIAKERNEAPVDEPEEEEGWDSSEALAEYQRDWYDEDDDGHVEESRRKQGQLLRNQFALSCLAYNNQGMPSGGLLP